MSTNFIKQNKPIKLVKKVKVKCGTGTDVYACNLQLNYVYKADARKRNKTHSLHP